MTPTRLFGLSTILAFAPGLASSALGANDLTFQSEEMATRGVVKENGSLATPRPAPGSSSGTRRMRCTC
jgi:hypothetical protein